MAVKSKASNIQETNKKQSIRPNTIIYCIPLVLQELETQR